MGKTAPTTFYKKQQILYFRKHFVDDDRFPFKDKEKLIATFDEKKGTLTIESAVKANKLSKDKEKTNTKEDSS